MIQNIGSNFVTNWDPGITMSTKITSSKQLMWTF